MNFQWRFDSPLCRWSPHSCTWRHNWVCLGWASGAKNCHNQRTHSRHSSLHQSACEESAENHTRVTSISNVRQNALEATADRFMEMWITIYVHLLFYIIYILYMNKIKVFGPRPTNTTQHNAVLMHVSIPHPLNWGQCHPLELFSGMKAAPCILQSSANIQNTPPKSWWPRRHTIFFS